MLFIFVKTSLLVKHKTGGSKVSGPDVYISQLVSGPDVYISQLNLACSKRRLLFLGVIMLFL